jgi:hypothetical protein
VRPIHCLYDIETIGCRDGAPIVQLGAVLFSPWGDPADFGGVGRGVCDPLGVGVISSPEGAFRMNVALGSDALHFADWSTIQWWLTKPEQQARLRVFAEPERSPIRDVLHQFAMWVRSWGVEPLYWWSDLDFDCRLVRQAYSMEGLASLCPFGSNDGPNRGVRDYRTLRWIGKSLGVEQAPRVGVEHDALDDAFHQAYYAIKVLRHLGVEKEA